MSPKASDKGNKKKQSKHNKATSKKGKRVSPGKLQSINSWLEKNIPLVLFASLAILLFIGPFQRGLFFPRELLVAKILIFGLFIVWGYFRLIKKDNRIIKTPLDICILVLLLAYVISFFSAVHTRDALEEVLKVAAYVVVYLIAIDVCRYMSITHFKAKQDDVQNSSSLSGNLSKDGIITESIPPGITLLLHVVLASAVVVTIASLGVPAGHWEFPGAYASDRIASPMGYANTAAAYFMAAYLLALGIAPLAKKWWNTLYLGPASLMLFAIILTFSRGAWLMLVPLSLLLIIIAAPGERLRSLLYLMATALAAIPTALMADPIYRSDAPEQAWLLVAVAVVVSVVLGLLAELYLGQTRKVRIAVAGGAGAAVFTGLFIIFIMPALGPIELERDLEEKAESQTVEQVLRGTRPDQEYSISMEVNAEIDPQVEEELDYVWRLRVLGGLPGYRDEEIFDYRGSATDGWEEKEFSFNTKEEMDRLDIRIYNRYPGTSVTARNVTLHTEDDSRSLRFALNRMLPDRFYDRLYSYSIDRNLNARVEFMEDAVQIIGDHPVLGTGGGGWNALYRSYQERPYNTTEVHNHFLQVWIEAGLVGFLAFLGIWISAVVAFIRNCFKNKVSSRVWQFWTASFLPIAALGAHSIIDWNFSMAAVGVFLFALLGANRSLDRTTWFGNKKKNRKAAESRGKFAGIGGMVIGVVLFIFSFMLLDGLYSTWRSQDLMERTNLKEAIIEIRNAINRDPFRSVNYYNFSLLKEDLVRSAGLQEDIMGEAISLARQAYELEPYNPRYVSRYGNLLLIYVDIDDGLEMLDRVIYLRPHLESSYRQAISARLELADYYLGEDERAEAEQYLEDIYDIEAKAKEHLEDTKPLAFQLGRAYYFLQDYSTAEEYFRVIGEDDDFYEEAQKHLEMIEDEI